MRDFSWGTIYPKGIDGRYWAGDKACYLCGNTDRATLHRHVDGPLPDTLVCKLADGGTSECERAHEMRVQLDAGRFRKERDDDPKQTRS